MSKHVVLAIFSILVTFLAFQASAFPTYLRDETPMSIVVDPEEYAEALGEDYYSPMVMKRFFTNHPSDYNPMRRPGPMPRGSKRDDTPFHPVPRIISMRRTDGSDEFGGENSEGYIANGRQKKQTRAATLIFRLGSLGMRRKPTVPPGPTA
ncbi:unnamed protein product [Orchesella dallaii]|uniref:Uncharacterized protein n=1 Tax=Orchesella dallaii TaxID=48710 RepID=A0ABP1PJQ8_9HEXA